MCNKQFGMAHKFIKNNFGMHMEDEEQVCKDGKEKLKNLKIKQE